MNSKYCRDLKSVLGSSRRWRRQKQQQQKQTFLSRDFITVSVCLSADDSDRTVFLLVGRRASLLQMR